MFVFERGWANIKAAWIAKERGRCMAVHWSHKRGKKTNGILQVLQFILDVVRPLALAGCIPGNCIDSRTSCRGVCKNELL